MKKPNKKANWKSMLLFSLLFTAVLITVSIFLLSSSPDFVKGSITYTDFLQDIEENEIESVILTEGNLLKVIYKEGKGLEDRFDADGTKIEPELEENKRVETVIVLSTDALQEIVEKGVDVQYKQSNSATIYLLLSNIPAILMIIILGFYLKMMFGGTKSPKGSLEATRPTVLFSDVAGMTEEKEEMLFAINSLKNSEEYEKKGVKPVRGILLEGPPGVGKTLLAKAVAGEAGVNFLSYSGSDFVEMFAGMGASRF